MGGKVDQVWACFAVFQLFRATAFAGRIWSKAVVNRILGFLFGGNRASFEGGTKNNRQADAIH